MHDDDYADRGDDLREARKYPEAAERTGWHHVITAIPDALSTVAYRYESGAWWIPDPMFNETSLVGAKVTPLVIVDITPDLAARIAQHSEKPGSPRINDGLGYCGYCSENWPCTVARLAKAVDA